MSFLILGVFLVLFFMRLFRWLAIVQQKEYRFDRIWLFHNSREGLAEVVRIVPLPQDFTRTGLKRPVRTGRVVVVGGIALAMAVTLFFSVLNNQSSPSDFLKVMTGLYLLVPILVLVSLLPTMILKEVATYWELVQAKSLISRGKPVILGITGSYGKTTTKQILFQILSEKFSVFTTPKSFNTRYSVARSIRRNYSLQDIAIIEYAAYTKGEIKALARWIHPDIAVITGLAPQHLGLFGSLENIVLAKSELVKAVANPRQVFCNGADSGAIEICKAGGVSHPTFFSGKRSVVSLKNAGLDAQGRLFFTWGSKKIQTPLVGMHYVHAVQAAIVVAEHLQLSRSEILAGLESLHATSSFIQTRRNSLGTLIIDDGKTSNQRGFEAALDLLLAVKGNKQGVLITSGIIDLGNVSSEIHFQLAQKARKIVAKVLYTGAEGKSEFKQVFGEDLIEGRSAIVGELQSFGKKDIVLIEGKIPGWVKVA